MLANGKLKSNFHKWRDRFSRQVLAHPDLSSTDKVVLWALLMHVNGKRIEATEDTSVWPQQKTLAKMTGLSERTVRRSLDRAAEVGVLETVRISSGNLLGRNSYVLDARPDTRVLSDASRPDTCVLSDRTSVSSPDRTIVSGHRELLKEELLKKEQWTVAPSALSEDPSFSPPAPTPEQVVSPQGVAEREPRTRSFATPTAECDARPEEKPRPLNWTIGVSAIGGGIRPASKPRWRGAEDCERLGLAATKPRMATILFGEAPRQRCPT